MAAPITATPTRSRTTSDFKLFAAVGLFAVAAILSLIALQVWAPTSADSSRSGTSQYGEGYPQHGGLAGPSRISVFEMYSRGAGYPVHGGLAGPSRVANSAVVSQGAGYPLHGGLAGPSRVANSAVVSQGAGYPLHGGLAGPSRVTTEGR